NGAEEEVRAEVSADRVLTARVRLRPRRNRLVVVLSNVFRRHAEEVTVYCPEPPAILSIAEPRPGATPRTDVVAEVRTAKDVPVLGVRLGGREVGKEALALAPVSGKAGLWQVRVKGVSLSEGDNALELRVRNDDGESPPRTVTARYRPPA